MMSASVRRSLKEISVPRKQSTISLLFLFSQMAPCVSVPWGGGGGGGVGFEKSHAWMHARPAFCLLFPLKKSRKAPPPRAAPPTPPTHLVVEEDAEGVLAQTAHGAAPDLGGQLLPVDALRTPRGAGAAVGFLLLLLGLCGDDGGGCLSG